MIFILNMFVTSWLDYKYLAAENNENNKILYVGGTGTGNYTSIQNAINDAERGNKIFLYNNIYYENIIIDKSIDLVGENKDLTIIDGVEQGSILNLTANWINISRITIKNSDKDIINTSYVGINIKDINNIYVNNTIILNCAIPINMENSNNILIQHTTIIDNILGIYIYNSSNNRINHCNISNITSDGITFYRSSFNIITNCIIKENINAVSLRLSSNNTLTNNIFSNNSVYGVNIVIVLTTDNITSENNIIFKNNFENNSINAHDGYNNSWDDGNYGNYWDDYNGKDNNSDGIGDTPYILYGNMDIYPLINPIKLVITDSTAPVLYLTILSPKNNSIINGLVEIKGTVTGNEEILGVKIKINDGLWEEAIGTKNWYFNWNTTQVDDGLYTISALVDSTEEKDITKIITVQVDNFIKDKEENGNGDNIPGFEILFLLGACLIIIILKKFSKIN
jgi:parallel beta-helix repeat protein